MAAQSCLDDDDDDELTLEGQVGQTNTLADRNSQHEGASPSYQHLISVQYSYYLK